jgi:hypothetical protein
MQEDTIRVPAYGDLQFYPDPPGTREELTIGSFAAAVGRGMTAGAMVCRERRRSRSNGKAERRPCHGPSRKSLPELALWVGETAELTGPAGHPPNSIYLGQDLRFVAPVKIGDTVKVVVAAMEKRDDRSIIKLRKSAANQRGELVVDGAAVLKKVGL